MGAFKATRCRQTLYHHLLKIVMRMLHSRVIPAIHLFIRPLVVAIVIRLQFAVSLLSLFAGSRCSYVILSAMHVGSCVWGLSRPPDDSKIMSLLYDNSSAHGIFTFHIGIRCSTLDCMSIWFTFLAAGMYLKNTLEYLGQAHHIRRAVVHPRLQYLLGLPLVSHMSRVKCFVSILLCSLFFSYTSVSFSRIPASICV